MFFVLREHANTLAQKCHKNKLLGPILRTRKLFFSIHNKANIFVYIFVYVYTEI